MRLFLALDLPSGARRELVAWRDRVLASRDALRPVPAAGLHVTLVFLGWADAERVADIWRATREALVEDARPPLLAPGRIVGVPRRRPRLVALDLADDHGRAAALQAAVAGSLSAAGLHEPEQRPFWPHVTLARLRKGARWQAPEDQGAGLAAFEAVAVTLYRSHLSPSGARYEALECRLLGSSG